MTGTRDFLPYLRATLIEHRERANLSQQQLGHAVGRNASTYSNFERGAHGWGGVDGYVRDYAEACAVTAEEIWEDAVMIYVANDDDNLRVEAMRWAEAGRRLKHG